MGHIGNSTPARRLVSAVIKGIIDGKSAAEVIQAETSDELKSAVAIAGKFNETLQYNIPLFNRNDLLHLDECLKNPIAFYANSLKKALDGEVNHKALTRIIAIRSEIDLADIKAAYESAFSQKLANDVKVNAECTFQLDLFY